MKRDSFTTRCLKKVFPRRDDSDELLKLRRANAKWAKIALTLLGPGEVPLGTLREAFPDHDWRLDQEVLCHLAPAGTDLDAVSVVVARELAAAGVPIREVRRGVSLERKFLDEIGE